MAQRLRRAKAIATSLLLACVALFVLARWLQPAYPGMSWLAAFAEAAIVGALADWYAVVVLFRHPLGLRMPHTAIIPANQARIADNLGRFIEQHLLSPRTIAQRLSTIDFSGLAGRWLADPARNAGLVDWATRQAPDIVAVLDHAGLRKQLGAAALARLEAIDVTPIAAGVLDAMTHEGRHHALLDQVLGALRRLLDDEAMLASVRERIREELPALFNMFNADAYLLNKLMRSAATLLTETEQNPEHPLRVRFDGFVADFVRDLRESDAYRDKAQALKHELLARPELAETAQDLWERGKAWLARDVEAGDASVVRARMAELLAGIGRQLQSDATLRAKVDRAVSAALQSALESNRHRVSRFVSEEVKSWDRAEMSNLIELNIGADLQYIRINGTLVGGSVGLLIHALTRLLSG